LSSAACYTFTAHITASISTNYGTQKFQLLSKLMSNNEKSGSVIAHFSAPPTNVS